MDLFQAISIDGGDETIRAALAATINRARANNLTPEGWSLAELNLDDNDVEWLQNWALVLDGATAKSWLRPEAATGTQGMLAVRRAAIGVLLLLLTAEQTRRMPLRKGGWATASSSFFNEQIRQLLFNQSEPTELYLDSLKQASERLHLRQNGGWMTPESEQDNVALQIALTESDLQEHWPRWLRDDNPPKHIKQLLDPNSGSPSFQQLWQDCQNFLQGKLTEAEMRNALTSSPWILSHWVDSIVESLKPHEKQSLEDVVAETPPLSIPAANHSQSPPPQLKDIFDSLTPYGGIKTIIRATRALLARASELGLRKSAWSLAELRVSEFDYIWLKIWAKQLQVPAVWFSTETQRVFRVNGQAGEETISFRAGLGSLLLLWIAETARRNAAEGELWPFISPSHFDQPVAAELFRKHQPSRFLRSALDASVRELNLRHALEGDSEQCWRDTVYLQFGFTRHGFKSRLPEWLSGRSSTLALLELLDEEKGSASFQELWQAMRTFLQGSITEAQLRNLITDNGWILAEWLDELIAEISAADGETVEPEEEAITVDALEPGKFLSELAAASDKTDDRKFIYCLAADLSHLKLTEGRYDLFIAGERQAQVLLRSGGRYLAEPGRKIVFHTASSRVAATMVANDGLVAASCELILVPGEDLASNAPAARLAANDWQVLVGDEVLTVHQAKTSLFRIKPLQRRDSRGEWLQWVVMEGEELVKRLNGGVEPLDPLQGLGAPLTVRSGPFNNPEDEFQFAASVIDRGIIEAAVCEVLPSITGRLNTGRLQNRTARVLRLKVQPQIELGEKQFVVWWNENGEVGKLLPNYCEDAEDGYWWVCKLPETVGRFIAVAIAQDGIRLGTWWEDGWAEMLPPVAEREPLLTAALLRWFRLPVLSREATPILRDLSRQYAAASLVAWLKGVGLPEWLRNDTPDKWISAVRMMFRMWWPEADTARQVLLALADARITDRLNDELLDVARALCQVDPLLLAATLKAVKDRIVICSPSEIRLRLAESETKSAYEARKQELITSCAAAFDVDRDSLQTDLLDCAARWLGGYELRRHEASNLALALQNKDSRLLVALHLLERI